MINAEDYKQVKGIFFKIDTPDAICEILAREYQFQNGRIRLFYGNTKTGKCWMDEYDTMGYVGRSSGSIKIPLLINNARSYGGGGILDSCIIKITKNHKVLYQHPKFYMPVIKAKNKQVFYDDKVYANCNTENQAIRLSAFMRGERNAK